MSQKIKFKKVFREVWEKKRGSAERVFSGHTTEYYINDIPVKKKDYQDRIAEIADEDIFRILTNPLIFNEAMHWQKRREILLSVCGNVTDQDVIAANPALSPLTAILGKRKIDDHRQVIATERKKINVDLEKIPVRIDEINRSKPTAEMPEALVDSEIVLTSSLIKETQEELTTAQNGGRVAELARKYSELETERLDLVNAAKKDEASLRDSQIAALDVLKSQRHPIAAAIEILNQEKTTLGRSIAANEKEADGLREKWHVENKRTLTYSQESVCPTCGQDLPAEKLEAARKEAEARFNQEKSETLEKISVRGQGITTQIETEQARIAQIEAGLVTPMQDLAKLDELILRQSDAALNVPLIIPEGYQALVDEIAKVVEELRTAKNGTDQQVQGIKTRLDGLSTTLLRLQAAKAAYEQGRKLDSRINELKSEERKLASEYARLESELRLTEDFTRAKVRMLDEKINSKFHLVRFRLFEEQINGGLADCCEAMVGGVPYGSVNRAAKTQAGLEIIRVIQGHFGKEFPLFIDNAEAVTQLPDMPNQVITMFVSKPDKVLRVEQHIEPARKAA